jgi:hypothetical protein
MRRRERRKPADPARIVAYDFETAPIRAGTPRPLYLTAHCDEWSYAGQIHSMAHLHEELVAHFLIPRNWGRMFVAWNGNRFDAYFVAAALVRDPRFVITPYLTSSRELRALVIHAAGDESSRIRRWIFADGMAMLGIDCDLGTLLDTFAPDLPKLPAPDWSRGFDARRQDHRDYAMRDSEGLWAAIVAAQRIVHGHFGEPLGITIGSTAIKVFQAEMPPGVWVMPLDDEARDPVAQLLARGGYVFCRGKYRGPVWKYDLNQAYAAAMRECAMPCGQMMRGQYAIDEGIETYMVLIDATAPPDSAASRVPFYVKVRDPLGRIRSTYARGVIRGAWITSDEHRQLIDEGWDIEIVEWWAWSRSFAMTDFVDRLETLRAAAPDGPQGAQGRMIKALGTTAYGKTAEQPDGIEYVLAATCPPGFLPWYDDDDAEPIDHVYWRFDPDSRPRPHHQPQIAAFITAHVRMKVRRAILLDPDAWLYADTDCVMFRRDVTQKMDIDPARYGAWKIEESGAEYSIIDRKVYVSADGRKKAARGLDVRALTGEHFALWFEGQAPYQRTYQLTNFLDVMRGAEMYVSRPRRGHATERTEDEHDNESTAAA